MNSIIDEVSDEIISDMQPPRGWDIIEEKEMVIADHVRAAEQLKQAVSKRLNIVTERVEQFVDRSYKDFNILIYETYIFIDADAAFHIMLLVKKDDYISSHMVALKILAKELLTTDEDVDMRFKFTIADEYFRFHYTHRAYKLRYVYKNPVPHSERDGIEFTNEKNIPHWTPNHDHHSFNHFW